jgi:hypothetical protein
MSIIINFIPEAVFMKDVFKQINLPKGFSIDPIEKQQIIKRVSQKV